jgi:hypothetical protein
MNRALGVTRTTTSAATMYIRCTRADASRRNLELQVALIWYPNPAIPSFVRRSDDVGQIHGPRMKLNELSKGTNYV